MNVTTHDLYRAYKAASDLSDRKASEAGSLLRWTAFAPWTWQPVAGELLVESYAADREAEQIYREYSALMDAEMAA